MARSTYIYLLSFGEPVRYRCSAFTVKHELINYIKDSPYDMSYWIVERFLDGRPEGPIQDITEQIEKELQKGLEKE